MRFSLNRFFGESPFKFVYPHTHKILDTVKELAKVLDQYLGRWRSRSTECFEEGITYIDRDCESAKFKVAKFFNNGGGVG